MRGETGGVVETLLCCVCRRVHVQLSVLLLWSGVAMTVSTTHPLSDDGRVISHRAQLHIGCRTCGQAAMHLTMHSDDGGPATSELFLTESQRSQAQGAVVRSNVLAEVTGDGRVLEQTRLSGGEGR